MKRGRLPLLALCWLYLGGLVALPLCVLLWRASLVPGGRWLAILLAPRTLAALRLTFGCATAAALINMGFGLLIAWVLTRYRFPGRAILDALIELPFALPTSVAGLTLTALYSQHGLLGRPLAAAGIKVAFTPLGVVLALVFVGLPYVVRTVQPVILELDPQAEEAARSLGASALHLWLRVQLPPLLPAALSGFALALCRGIGEYGSVLFISGNLPLRTEIAPLLIASRLEQFDYQGASVLAALLLLCSLLLLAGVHGLSRWAGRRFAAVEDAP